MSQRGGCKPLVKKLLSSTMLGGLAAVAAPMTPALAVCSGSPTVTCSAATTSFGNGTQDNLTINVQSGATITNGAGDAVNVRDGNIINLQGATSSIVSTNNTAITMQNGASQINNNNGGTISGGSNQAIFWQPSGSGATLSITNSGTISGTSLNISNAIWGGGGANVLTIDNSGTISGAGANTAAVYTPNTNVVLTSNTGTMTGGQYGILANGLSGTNGVGGIIGGAITLIGIQSQTAGLNLTNLGTIQGTNNAVTVTGGAPPSTLINAGTITSAGNAVIFDGNDNKLELRPGSSITGNVLGGSFGGSNNQLELGGTGTASFNATDIDTGAFTQQYQRFTTFNKSGTSNWTLTGTGAQTWNVSGGTLTGTTASAAGNIVLSNGATFALNQTTANGNHGGLISGTGNLVKTGAFQVTLTSANSYSGNTTVSGGTLLLSGAATLGATTNSVTVNSGAATLDLGGTTQTQNGGLFLSNGGTITNGTLISSGTFSLSQSGLVGAVMAGTGNVTKTGPGGVTLGAANTYTGSTVITDGNLNFTGAGTLGNVANSVTINGATAALLLSGTTQTQNGGVTLQGGGSIQNGTLSSSGTFAMQAGTVSAVLAGTGGVSKTTSGTVTFSGANTYTGGTSITAGILGLTGAGTLGAPGGATSVSGATAVLDLGGTTQTQNGGVTLAGGGTITGGSLNGAVTSTGGTISNVAGAMSLTANGGTTQMGSGNAYTGATIINSGATVQGGAANSFSALSATTVNTGGIANFGGLAQTINNVALAGGTLTNGALAGAISSTGGTINGLGGTATLITTSGTTNILGANTFSGATTVNGGLLSVTGSMTSAITVNAGGTLGGTGIAGPTTISGGTLSPGNSIGTITIAGNLQFVGPGNYVVEVSPVAADKTNVTGTANLAGTIQFLPSAGTYTAGTKYSVLNATGGVSGTFASTQVTGSFGGAINAKVEYDANNVYLVLAPNAISPFLIGGTRNQRAVAGAIDTALGGGNVAPLFLGLFNLTATQLPAALDQLSGEVHASTAGALLDESLYARQAVLGRLRQASYGGNTQMASLTMGGPQAFAGDEELSALAYAKSPIVTKAPPMVAPGPDVVFWGQGFGARGRFEADGNATNVRRDLAGFFSGVDTRVGSNGRLGVAAGYTASKNNLDGRGSSNVETGHVSGYGGWAFGNFNLRAGGAFGWHQIETSRAIVFPGFFDVATASYNGRTGQIFGEAGYGFAFGNVAVEPFAGGAWVRLNTDGFNERANVAGLAVAANTFEVGYSNVGIRAASMIPLGSDMILIPRASLAWQHAFNNVTPEARLAFIAAPAPFVIGGSPIARDSLLGEAGLDLAIGRNATVGVSYTGQLARNVQDHAAKGKFSWKF